MKYMLTIRVVLELDAPPTDEQIEFMTDRICGDMSGVVRVKAYKPEPMMPCSTARIDSTATRDAEL